MSSQAVVGSAEADQSAPDQPRPFASIRGASTVTGDFAAIAGGRLTAGLLSLLTVIFTTRLLGPAGYGTVALVGIVSTLIFTVSTAWTGIAVRRYGREDLELRGNMRRLTWSRLAIGAPLLVGTVGAVIVLKALQAVPAGISWTLAWIAIAGAITNIVMDHWVCLLETGGRMKVSAASQVIVQLVYVIGVASLFSLKVRTSPEIVLLLSLGSGVLFAVGVAPFVWRSGVLPPEFDRALLRRVLWLSTPVIALMASQYVFASVDIVVLRVFRGQHDAGVYAVAYQAYTVLSGVAVTATAVFLPLFVSLRIGGRESLVDRYLTSIVPEALFLLAVLAGLAIPFLPALVPLVFGQAFAAASTPLCLLVVGLVFLFAAYSIAPILTLHERTRATAVINGVAALVNLVGDLLLVAVLHVGVVAPAIATTTSLVRSSPSHRWLPGLCRRFCLRARSRSASASAARWS
jgi:O-antigen/teichoic acid export membrane protein